MEPLILMIEPELDERAATATMTRAQRVYEEGARDISKVMRQQLTEGTAAAGKGFDELETKARKAYLSMQDAGEKVAAAERKHQAAVEKGATNAEALGRRVERARLAEIEAIEKATDAYKEYGAAAKSAEGAGRSVFQGLADGMSSGRFGELGQGAAGRVVSGLMSGAGEASAAGASLGGMVAAGLGGALAAGGAVAIGGLWSAMQDGLGQLRVRDLFQARLGVDNGTMEHIGSSAGDAYARGFGDSVEENLKTITAGIRSGLIGPKSSDAELSKFTERMNTTQQITGHDPTEIAAKSRNLIRNGLVADYTEVLDLLNSDAGQQLGISGEVLDTLEEYATDWHKAGLSAQDTVGLMKQMSDAGIRNTDAAADSIREFITNVSDGTKQTGQALTALGFNADDMNRRFAEGGASARDAFGEVLKALQAVKDPVDKQNVGLALFKSRWEENRTAIEKMDLGKVADDLGKVGGATDDDTKKVNEHADAWGNLGRAIENTIGSFGRWLANTGPGSFLWHDMPQMAADSLSPPPVVQPGFTDPGALNHDPTSLADLMSPDAGAGSKIWAPPGAPSPTAPPWAPGLNGLFPQGFLPPGAAPPPPGVQHGPQGHMPTPTDSSSGAKPSLPPAPVLPLTYSNTAGLPSSIANATTSLDDARHEVAEKEARLHQLEQTNVATADDITKAHNDLAKAQQNQLRAEQSLTDARVNATKQANKQLGQLSSDLDDMGAKLDKDFGISKGLGGIVENAVKALGNILAAPFLQALRFVSKANPNEGSGLVGVAAANGMFGAQYTPAMLAAAQMSGTAGMMPGYNTAALGGSFGGNANAAIALAQSANGGKYGWGASDLADKLADCSGAVSDLVEVMQNGTANPGRLFDTESFPAYASSHGWQQGLMPGALNVGVLHGGPGGGHMAATLPNGVNFESGGSHGGIAYGGPAAGAASPQFTEHWYLPTGGGGPVSPYASPSAPAAPGATLMGGQSLTDPGLTPGPGGGGGGQFPQAAPFGLNARLDAAGLGGAPQPPAIGLGSAYPAHGGNSGNLLGGLPMDGLMGAAGAADLMMPGAGSLAKIGIQIGNRTIGYAAQNAGIAASGLMETLSVGDNPRGSLGNSWLGKLAGGLAGAAPALPNLAGGGKKPPGAMQQPGGGQQGGNTSIDQSDRSINVTNQRASEDQTGKIIAEHQAAMYAPPGRQ